MNTLTRVMRDAADDAPVTLDVGEQEWVDSSWRTGRRRRAVRGAAAGAGLAAAAALVVSLVVSGVGGMPSASVPADGSSRSSGGGVSSYPQRIGHQWWVRDLPASPGPVAGVLSVHVGDGSGDAWQVLTPRGARYRLPTTPMSGGTFPAVSADGTRVGWLANDGAYRVQDLLSGHQTRFPQLGTANLDGSSKRTFVGGRAYGLAMQFPGFFSPSGDALAVVGFGASPSDWSGVLVLQDDGSVTEVAGLDQPAGWLDADRLVGRTVAEETGTDKTQPGDTGVDLVVWDRRTGLTTPLVRVELPEPTPRTINDAFGQFWGAVRSDGTLWVSYSVSLPDGSVSSNQQLVGYALPTGRPVSLDGRPVTAPQPLALREQGDLVSYQRFWHGSSPLGGTEGENDLRVVTVPRPHDLLVVTDPVVHANQVIWAQDAIDGSPSWSPFGTSTFLPLWWWKEITLAVLALAAARWWLTRRRLRHRARRTTRVPV